MHSSKTESRKLRSISVEVQIATAWSEEERCFMAWSPQLGCLRDGATSEAAIAMCAEATEVLVESWLERNTLEENLLQRGYRINKSRPTAFDWPEGQDFDLQAEMGLPLSGNVRLANYTSTTVTVNA